MCDRGLSFRNLTPDPAGPRSRDALIHSAFSRAARVARELPEPRAYPSTMFLENPRGMRDPLVYAQRKKMLGFARLAPLREWAAGVTAATGRMLPEFDPADGGVESRVIILHEALPFARSAMTDGPRIISVDNDSDIAELLWRTCRAGGLPQGTALHWTVVPWYLEDPHELTRSDIRDGSAYLLELLYLLPDLQTVLLCGELPRQAWAEFIAPLVDKYTVIPTWDAPSALNGPPIRRQEMEEAFHRAARGMH